MEIYVWLVAYFIITVVFYLTTHIFERMWSRKAIKGAKRVLLVIAHPDDECMFFGPTILGLMKTKEVQFYVLCLSIGDFDGKGSQRKGELWESCKVLGIPSENITLLNYEHLRDDPSTIWPVEISRRALLSHVCSLHIDTIITFDEKGISGHLNHIACFKSVESLITNKLLPSYCKAYALDSVLLLRKYMIGILDVPFCYFLSRFVYVANGHSRSDLVQAMRCHKSQNVWFRKLYVMMSRYLILNTLSPILEDVKSSKDFHRKVD